MGPQIQQELSLLRVPRVTNEVNAISVASDGLPWMPHRSAGFSETTVYARIPNNASAAGHRLGMERTLKHTGYESIRK